MSAIDVIAAVLIVVGSLLAFTSAIGIARFPDTLSRMHAATKPQTFGMILVLAGTYIKLDGHPDGGMLVLTGLFALITAPVVAQRVGRLVYREQALDGEVVDADQLDDPELDDPELDDAEIDGPGPGSADTGAPIRRVRPPRNRPPR